MIRIEAAGRSHPGLVRTRNEDAMYVGTWLFAVADGLGGHAAGDVASATVIESLRAFDQQVETSRLIPLLGRAVSTANDALGNRVAADPELRGMGTTLVAFMWSGTTAVLANVGDSRAYLLRTGESLTRLTEDHTYANLVADAAAVPNLPASMARWLDGRADGRSPDLGTWTVYPGDRFLLCSDGLSSCVPHHLIGDLLAAPDPIDETADRLVSAALDHGGPDNVTAIVANVLGAR